MLKELNKKIRKIGQDLFLVEKITNDQFLYHIFRNFSIEQLNIVEERYRSIKYEL